MIKKILHKESYTKNPTQKTRESVLRGRALFNTYCAVCHGVDGLSQTVVVDKGVPAPPITAFFKIAT